MPIPFIKQYGAYKLIASNLKKTKFNHRKFNTETKWNSFEQKVNWKTFAVLYGRICVFFSFFYFSHCLLLGKMGILVVEKL